MVLINVPIWRNIIHQTSGLNCWNDFHLEDGSGEAGSGGERGSGGGFPRVSEMGCWRPAGAGPRSPVDLPGH